jgi:hypothetical protein
MPSLKSRVASLACVWGLKERVQDASKEGADASAATQREEGEGGTGLDQDLDQRW